MQNNRIYKSKVDLWLMLIVVVAFGAQVLAGIHSFLTEGLYHPATLTLFISSLFFAGVMLGLAYPVTYEITQTELIIRSGLTKTIIQLESIESIKPSRSPLSSPAWSLDRLHINYKRKNKRAYILISPDDKSAFLNELSVKNNNITLSRDRISSQSL